ncbi:maleate cis-trans isomerase family protein [Pseudophaeobacter sp.]|uniref:maleate cis-trans isomerase family protein n=1 Tax=Pseudophaeobacter sp. TaxID=1971739 RepID=UPI004057D13F
MFQPGQTIQSTPRTPELSTGRHHRAKLGFILMSTDPSAEGDFRDMAPEGVGVHITRLKTDDYTTNETLSRHIEHMADAASRIQPEARPDVVSYSCTSGSIVIGEQRIFKEIHKGAPWAQPMCLVQGVLDALHELGAKKLVVGTPYLDEINTAEAEFLVERGFEVLDIQGLNIAQGWDMGLVTPEYWKKFALEIDQPDADVIFLSCGGIRALEVVEEIEQVTGKPVITSNQAQMWSCLRRAGIMDELEVFGQIFKHPGKALKSTL